MKYGKKVKFWMQWLCFLVICSEEQIQVYAPVLDVFYSVDKYEVMQRQHSCCFENGSLRYYSNTQSFIANNSS